MDNIEREKVGRFWFGSGFRWDSASADERAVVLAKEREQAAPRNLLASIADGDSRPMTLGLYAQTVRAIAAGAKRQSARIAELERKVAALEGEKAVKPRIRLRSVAGDK